MDRTRPRDAGCDHVYTVTPYLAGVAKAPRVYNSTATTQNVIGLTNASKYTFRVAATNTNGTGPKSDQSALVAVGAPIPPTTVTATPADNSAAVHWNPPTTDNGSPITGYTITPTTGTTTLPPTTYTDPATTETVTGLTNGTPYTFTVKAINTRGASPASTPSPPTTPHETTPPTVTSITRADPDPTNAATLSWTVTFDEPITGLSTANFGLSGSAGTGATITATTGTATTWTVTADTAPGDGTLALDLNDPTGIQDLAGNQLASLATGETYTIDKTAPTVLSITRADPDPTTASTVSWTITFDEPVLGLTTTNLSLSGDAAPGATIQDLTGAATTWTATATTTPGTLELDLTDPTGIQDPTGNPLTTTLNGEPYTIQ